MIDADAASASDESCEEEEDEISYVVIERWQRIAIPLLNPSAESDATCDVAISCNGQRNRSPRLFHQKSPSLCVVVEEDDTSCITTPPKSNSLPMRTVLPDYDDSASLVSSGCISTNDTSSISCDSASTSTTNDSGVGCGAFPSTSNNAGGIMGFINSKFKRMKKSQSSDVLLPTQLILNDRPSNLPSKSKRELELHMRQYEEMVKATQKKIRVEAKLKQRSAEIRMSEEEDKMRRTAEWREMLPPNVSSNVAGELVASNGSSPEMIKCLQNKRARELWFYGLPSAFRGLVWRATITNKLNITRSLFDLYSQPLREVLHHKDDQSAAATDTKASILSNISLDVGRTFPQLNLFKEGYAYHDPLVIILSAYTCYRPDINYVQGMSYLSALLLLNMNEFDTFVCFANIINMPCLLSFFQLNERRMDICYDLFWRVLTSQLPHVAAHLEKFEIAPDMFLRTWIMTLFLQTLSIEVAARIVDLFIRDGDRFLFQAALALVATLEKQLMESNDFEELMQLLLKPPSDCFEIEMNCGALLFSNCAKFSKHLPNQAEFCSLLVVDGDEA